MACLPASTVSRTLPFFCSLTPLAFTFLRNSVVLASPSVASRYWVVATKAPDGAQANSPLYCGSTMSASVFGRSASSIFSGL